jgi:uncharacterized repeat protein (TIGR03803 family)
MSFSCLRNASLMVLCSLAASAPSMAAQATYRVVAYSPYSEPGGITEAEPGLLYASAEGYYALSVTIQGAVTTVASFPPASDTLESNFVIGANGRAYSSLSAFCNDCSPTYALFSIASAPGSEQTYKPQSLIPWLSQSLPDGTFLGSASGLTAPFWSLVKADLDGNVTPLYQFPSSDVAGATLYGADGNYYGTGNTHSTGLGYVYQLTPAGTFTKLYNFTSSGASILIQGTDGNFYGTTMVVGNTEHGTAYKLSPSGQYTLLHTFGTELSGVVDQLTEGSDGKLYGVTENNTFFSLTTAGQYEVIYHVTNGNVQGLCACQMTQASDGIFYGTASAGGPRGTGLFFALDAGLPKPAPRSQHFEPQSGAAGTLVRIWGYNLLSASVEFNGVPASKVSNKGPNYIFATVPAGATTGPITVTAPGGTTTTQANFIVP